MLVLCARYRGPAGREDQQDPERGEQVSGECRRQTAVPPPGPSQPISRYMEHPNLSEGRSTVQMRLTCFSEKSEIKI